MRERQFVGFRDRERVGANVKYRLGENDLVVNVIKHSLRKSRKFIIPPNLKQHE